MSTLTVKSSPWREQRRHHALKQALCRIPVLSYTCAQLPEAAAPRRRQSLKQRCEAIATALCFWTGRKVASEARDCFGQSPVRGNEQTRTSGQKGYVITRTD